MDFWRRKRTIFRPQDKVARGGQLATAAQTYTANQGDSDLRGTEKFANRAVHDFEHLWNISPRVISDIDACGEGPLTGPLEHYDVGFRVQRAGRKRYVKVSQQSNVKDIQRWTVHCDTDHPFFFFNPYAQRSVSPETSLFPFNLVGLRERSSQADTTTFIVLSRQTQAQTAFNFSLIDHYRFSRETVVYEFDKRGDQTLHLWFGGCKEGSHEAFKISCAPFDSILCPRVKTWHRRT